MAVRRALGILQVDMFFSFAKFTPQKPQMSVRRVLVLIQVKGIKISLCSFLGDILLHPSEPYKAN